MRGPSRNSRKGSSGSVPRKEAAYRPEVSAVREDAFVLLCPAPAPLVSNIALIGDVKNLKFMDL